PDEAFHYPNEGEGYDGQFVYYIARDPLNAAPLIDVPAYRYQRILLPTLGFTLSFGQAALVPFALLAVNLAALGLGTYLLGDIFDSFRVSRWYALGYSLSLAALGTTRLTLPEVLAYGLCIAGVWLLLRERLLLCAVMFALAALARETTIVFAAGIGFYLLSQRKIGAAFTFGAVILVPFTLLQIALYAAFGSFGVGSGGGGATGFEFIPFMGVIRILTVGGVEVFAALMALIGPFVIFPTLWGLWRCWRDFRSETWSLYTWLLLFNSAIMLFVPFSTYRETNGILRFIAGLIIAVILYAAHKRNRRALRYSTLWAITSVILVYSDIVLVGEM
ncbi:MAG: hypothetical protein AAFV33_25140, partial [Chloroflexota bacterium]